MAEPQHLSSEDLHPCLHCNGKRQLSLYEWRAPAYWAVCLACDNAQAGETADEAMALWNGENPARVLAPEDEIPLGGDVSDEGRVVCAEGAHIVQKMASGMYSCFHCGLAFSEHHEIVVQSGVTSRTRKK